MWLMQSMSVDAEFTYDTGGRVTRVDYEYSKRRYYLEYTYDATGQLEKVVDAYYEEPELVTEREKLQHFIYRPDGTISAFDVNVTTVNELQYADGFLPGEKIFTEKWVLPSRFDGIRKQEGKRWFQSCIDADLYRRITTGDFCDLY